MQKIHHYIKTITLTTPVAIIIGAIIIAIGLMGYGLITQGSSSATPSTMFNGRTIDKTDYVEGKANSKVVVIEYSDPECPYCISLSPTMKQIRSEYSDKVAFVYRHFPLSIHEHAFDESKAIECAGILGGNQKYFTYIDALFGYKQPKQSQTNPSPLLTATGKEDLATSIGLDKESFLSCLNNANTNNLVDASVKDGLAAGVNVTPATFVLVKKGKGYEVVSMIAGAQDKSYFEAAINSALSK